MKQAIWLGYLMLALVGALLLALPFVPDNGLREVLVIVAAVAGAESAMLLREAWMRRYDWRLWRRHIAEQLLGNHSRLNRRMESNGRPELHGGHMSGMAQFSMWDLAKDRYMAVCGDPAEAAAMVYIVDAQRACATPHQEPYGLEWRLGFDATVVDGRWQVSRELTMHHSSARLGLRGLEPFLDADQRKRAKEFLAINWPQGPSFEAPSPIPIAKPLRKPAGKRRGAGSPKPPKGN